MSSGVGMLRALLFLLDVGGAQVLATGKSDGAEIDFKYAIIGTALGFAISAGFLALKICFIRKHLSDNDSSDLKSVHLACNDTMVPKKRTSRHKTPGQLTVGEASLDGLTKEVTAGSLHYRD